MYFDLPTAKCFDFKPQKNPILRHPHFLCNFLISLPIHFHSFFTFSFFPQQPLPSTTIVFYKLYLLQGKKKTHFRIRLELERERKLLRKEREDLDKVSNFTLICLISICFYYNILLLSWNP